MQWTTPLIQWLRTPRQEAGELKASPGIMEALSNAVSPWLKEENIKGLGLGLRGCAPGFNFLVPKTKQPYSEENRSSFLSSSCPQGADRLGERGGSEH